MGFTSGNKNLIPQVTTPPVSPLPGSSWILVTGEVGAPGQAMGVLGLTYSTTVAAKYEFLVQSNENRSNGVELKQYGR